MASRSADSLLMLLNLDSHEKSQEGGRLGRRSCPISRQAPSLSRDEVYRLIGIAKGDIPASRGQQRAAQARYNELVEQWTRQFQAALTLAILPMIIVYAIFQRQIQAGLTAGALK